MEQKAADIDREGRETALKQAILAYLDECPQAMDTLEGIAEWWVMRQQIRLETEAVTSAVGQLVEQGLLDEVAVINAKYYRLKNIKVK